MSKFLDSIPLMVIIVLAVLLGLAPMFPEPHLIEKTRMLVDGTVGKPIDIFDLFLHSSGIVLLVLKLIRLAQMRAQRKRYPKNRLPD